MVRKCLVKKSSSVCGGKEFYTFSKDRKACLLCIEDANNKRWSAADKLEEYDKSSKDRQDELLRFARLAVLDREPQLAGNEEALFRKARTQAKSMAKYPAIYCHWCGDKFIPNIKNRVICYGHPREDRNAITTALSRERAMNRDAAAMRDETRSIAASPCGCASASDMYLSMLKDQDDIAYYQEKKIEYEKAYVAETLADADLLAQLVFLEVRVRVMQKQLLRGVALPADAKMIGDEVRKNIDQIRNLMGDLQIRKDLRKKHESEKSMKQLMDELIDDCCDIYDNSEWGPSDALCGECPKWQAMKTGDYSTGVVWVELCSDCPRYQKMVKDRFDNAIAVAEGVDDK